MLCNKIVKQYGIKLVAHLDSESGNFITYQELCNKSENNISFITYYGIIEAIVPLWKRILKNDSKMDNPHKHFVNEIFMASKPTSITYNELITRLESALHKK